MTGRPIDVRELISKYSIEDHARKAGAYLERLPQENLGVAHPFSSPEIALDVLPKLQAMLYSAKLYKGARVLDFGAGAGWLSRALATMGLHPTALDVSTTVLRTAREIAEQTLERKVADRIKYLRHDGLKFAAANGAFDRVLSFEAFHHVPDQGRILREIHRVLAEDGIASFVEPGPDHSKTQASQEAMGAHEVIENDIVIEQIWEEAKQTGFSECNLWFYSLAPMSRPIQTFNAIEQPENGADLLQEIWNSSILPIRRSTRVFTLHKGPPETSQTSRRREGLLADVRLLSASEDDRTFTCALAIRNTGTATWMPSGGMPGDVNFGPRVQYADGRPDFFLPRVELSRNPTPPGAEITITLRAPLALIDEGDLTGSLVAEHVIWFEQNEGNYRYLLRRSKRSA